MRRLESIRRTRGWAVLASLTLGFAAQVASGADTIWTGATSNAWEVGSNWSSGSAPNGSGATAVIGLAANNPVRISSAVLLGGATSTSLSINDNAAGTALDIVSGGTLTLTGATAGIFDNKIITLEGLLQATYSPYVPPHHPPPPLSIYPVAGTGSIKLLGGTIVGTGTKGAWGINVPMSGYGTLANRVFLSNTVTVDDGATISITGGVTLQGGTLSAAGNGYYTNLGSIGGYGTITAPLSPGGQIPNSGGVTTLLADISGGCRIGHEGETDVGSITLVGTSDSHVNFDNDSGPVNLIGDPIFSGYVDIGSNGPFNLNGHTITLTYGPDNTPPVIGIISAVSIGTGTIDNATSANLDFSQGPYTLAGGSITSSGGGAFIRGGIYGWGKITAPIIPCGSAAIVNANSSGHTLQILGTVDLTIPTINGNLIASNGGILELGPGSVVTTSGPTNFTGYISPGSGSVVLSGAALAGGSSPIRLNNGPVHVAADSSVGGPIDCAATITIDSDAALTISGGTETVSLSGGSLTNHGALDVGSGLLKNATASTYSFGGNGSITIGGGSITGTHGFSNANTLSGFGALSAPFTNNGTVRADVDGETLTLTGTAAASIVNSATGVIEARNGGTLSIASSSQLANHGAIIAGPTGTIEALGGALDPGDGSLSGSGTVNGSVLNATGTVTPGPAPGTLLIEGDYSQTGGTLSFDLDGASQAHAPAMAVTGNATLGGILAVSTLGRFQPTAGQEFTVLTAAAVNGVFAHVSAPPGMRVKVRYYPTSVVVQIVGGTQAAAH